MDEMDKMARELLCSHCDMSAEDYYEEMPVTAPEAESAIRTALLTAPPGWKLLPADHPDVFQVRLDGEWGTFVLRQGRRKDACGTAYWCELIAATSFGTVSHHWSSMGQPAAKFLPRLERDYALSKLWGLRAFETDVEATMVAVRHDIIEARRHGDITADEAREAWDSLPDWATDDDELMDAAKESSYLMSAMCDGGCRRTRINPQADGFWRYLWPRFLEQLAAAPEVK